MKKEKDINTKEKALHDSAKPGFNAVDLLIVILVVACIGGVVLRFTVLDDLWTTRNLEEYDLTFEASGLTYAQCQSIATAVRAADQSGSWAYLDDGETKLGTLIMTSDYMQNREELSFKDESGNTVTVIPDENVADEDVRWTITATVRCRGKLNQEKGFLLNGRQYVAPNSELDVRIIDCDFSIRITDIEKSDVLAG